MMSAIEAIEQANKLLELGDEFEIASILIHIEADAEQRGMREALQQLKDITDAQ